MALQPRVGHGFLYNTPPSLSIPCSVSPSIYSHLSHVRGHDIQPSHFWSSSSSCCIQLSIYYIRTLKMLLHVSILRSSPGSTYCSLLKLHVKIVNTSLYRVSQEECARLRDGVPYVKVYRYNPKYLCPKLNGYGDNGHRSLKL